MQVAPTNWSAEVECVAPTASDGNQITSILQSVRVSLDQWAQVICNVFLYNSAGCKLDLFWLHKSKQLCHFAGYHSLICGHLCFSGWTASNYYGFLFIRQQLTASSCRLGSHFQSNHHHHCFPSKDCITNSLTEVSCDSSRVGVSFNLAKNQKILLFKLRSTLFGIFSVKHFSFGCFEGNNYGIHFNWVGTP